MTLASQLANQVDKAIQQRGRNYYFDRAVRIVKGGPDSVTARVRGSDNYHVTLERKKDLLRVSCDCPYFDDNLTTCKHVWATILAADAQGYLQQPSNGRLRIVEIGEDEEYDDYRVHEWGEEDEEDDEEDDETYERVTPYPASPPVRPVPAPRIAHPPQTGWKKQLAGLQSVMEANRARPQTNWPAGREVLYVVDATRTLEGNGLVVDIAYRERKRDGDWSKPKTQRIPATQIPQMPEPADREILSLLMGAKEQKLYGGYGYNAYYDAPVRYVLTSPQGDAFLPLMCRTGRCFLRPPEPGAELRPLSWDEGPPWEFWLEVAPQGAGKQYTVAGSLRRGEERMSLSAPVLLVRGGFVFSADRVARLQDFDAFDWISLFRRQSGPLSVPVKQKDELLKQLLRLPRLPCLDLPEEMRFEEVAIAPVRA